MNQQYGETERRLLAVRDMNLQEGMSHPAAAVTAHAMFPPSFDLVALLKATGSWKRDGKTFYKAVSTRAKQLSKELGRLRKEGKLADGGEAKALEALSDYAELATSRSDAAGEMLGGWVESVHDMHRSMQEIEP